MHKNHKKNFLQLLLVYIAGVVLLVTVTVVLVLTMGEKQSVPSKAKVETETTKPPVSEVSKRNRATTNKMKSEEATPKSASVGKKKAKKEGKTDIVPVSLSGTWDGYFISYGRKINFQLNLNQNGSSISGSTYEIYEGSSYTANVNGDIRGNSINFVKNMEGRGFEPIEYVGTLSDNKISLFGKWYIKKTGSTGEWVATKRN